MNHYTRPGFDAWWIALGISAVVPVEIHWMMTNAWTHVGFIEPITRWLFPRLAQVYGFTSTPSMPPKQKDVNARAQAARRVLKVAQKPGAIIAIAPEGRDHPGGILGTPPPGAGRFIHQLTKHCQLIVPIGVYDDMEHFYIHFGPPYQLESPADLLPDERDHHVTQQVMQSIAALLPPRLRGIYDPI
jgi:1-acyl-sn-glycerol-3-phosphate acyltransferase